MRISREKAQANKSEVVAQASRLFRERGLGGPSVTDVMRAAGLTHGGFYNHFSSKAELQARALAHNFDAAVARLAAIAPVSASKPCHSADEAPDARTGQHALHAYISNYLSPKARDANGVACPMVAFGADVTREDAAVRLAYAEGLERYIGDLTRIIADAPPPTLEATAPELGGDAPQSAWRNQAMALMATLVGGLSLARSVAQENPELSDALLAASRQHALDLANLLKPA